jgi:hypothetical protein
VSTIQLPVVHFDQKPGLCGAATAQTILFFTNPGQVGNKLSDQLALWATIQANTGGVRPTSPPAIIDQTDCPTWAKQQCDKCEGAKDFVCWCTYPPGLEATLKQYLPVALTVPADAEAATVAVIASVDFQIPSAALVFNGLHWLTVAGYETDGPNARPIGGRQISAIYISDPEVGVANHQVSIDDWLNQTMTAVAQCGFYLNKLAVIAGTGPRGVPPHAPTNLRIGAKARLPPRKKRPTRPGRNR